MTTPREELELQVLKALKAGDKERLSTLRMLLNTVKNEQIRVGGEVEEVEFLNLVRKGIKQRQEASEQYRLGKRDDLAAKEEREAEILSTYLPPPIDEDELRGAVQAYAQEAGLSGPKGIGPMMKEMLARYGGQADGATISRIAREILSDSE
jgi:uncharacterized protein YqeY